MYGGLVRTILLVTLWCSVVHAQYCVLDSFERNDDFSTATLVQIAEQTDTTQYENLTICVYDDVVDYYLFNSSSVIGTALIRFGFGFENSAGNIDSVAYNDSQVQVMDATSSIDNEPLGFTVNGVNGGGLYYVKVYRGPGAFSLTTPYTLDVTSYPCYEDSFEAGSNYGPFPSLLLGQTVSGLTVCGNDWDIFQVSIPTAQVFSAIVTGYGNMIPNIAILNANGNTLVSNTTQDMRIKRVDYYYSQTPDTVLLVRVWPDSFQFGTGVYALRISPDGGLSDVSKPSSTSSSSSTPTSSSTSSPTSSTTSSSTSTPTSSSSSEEMSSTSTSSIPNTSASTSSTSSTSSISPSTSIDPSISSSDSISYCDISSVSDSSSASHQNTDGISPTHSGAIHDGDSSPSDRTSNRSTSMVIGIGIAGTLVFASAIAAVIIALAIRKKHKKQKQVDSTLNQESDEAERTRASYSTYNYFAKESVSYYDRSSDIIPYNALEMGALIGNGSFGDVYKAKWRGSTVAVKQMAKSLTTEVAVNAFRKEATVMRNLRPHPNVVLFLGVCVPPDPTCIVTEFLKNGSLYNYIRMHDLDLHRKVKMMLGVANGMLHLHSEGVIHRDLAARNILLGANLDPKVADFGMSRTVVEGEDGSMTQNSTGPLKWMAPESIESNAYSQYSDVWSFGVVCWEILNCSDPFPRIPAVQAASALLLHQKRLSIPRDELICPMRLGNLMEACWAIDVNSRPNFGTICAVLHEVEKEMKIRSGSMRSHVVDRHEIPAEYDRTPIGVNDVPVMGQSASAIHED